MGNCGWGFRTGLGLKEDASWGRVRYSGIAKLGPCYYLGLPDPHRSCPSIFGLCYESNKSNKKESKSNQRMDNEHKANPHIPNKTDFTSFTSASVEEAPSKPTSEVSMRQSIQKAEKNVKTWCSTERVKHKWFSRKHYIFLSGFPPILGQFWKGDRRKCLKALWLLGNELLSSAFPVMPSTISNPPHPRPSHNYQRLPWQPEC